MGEFKGVRPPADDQTLLVVRVRQGNRIRAQD